MRERAWNDAFSVTLHTLTDGYCMLWFVQGDVNDCHMITHALLLIRATQTCWYGRDVFQQWNTHPL
jgi:hypothetical protein